MLFWLHTFLYWSVCLSIYQYFIINCKLIFLFSSSIVYFCIFFLTFSILHFHCTFHIFYFNLPTVSWCIYLSVKLSIYQSVYMSVNHLHPFFISANYFYLQYIFIFIYTFVYLPIHLSIHQSTYHSISVSMPYILPSSSSSPPH